MEYLLTLKWGKTCPKQKYKGKPRRLCPIKTTPYGLENTRKKNLRVTRYTVFGYLQHLIYKGH